MTYKVFKSKRFKKLKFIDKYWDYYRHKTLPFIVYVKRPDTIISNLVNDGDYILSYSLYCQVKETGRYNQLWLTKRLRRGNVPDRLPSDKELNLILLSVLGKIA